jgi:hypothetical protein
MKDERKNIKEPYSPENTPNPPQIIDPSRKKEHNEDEVSVENKQETRSSMVKKEEPKIEKKSSEKAGGFETDIQDDTTI